MLYGSKRLGGAHANLCISGIAIKILIRSPPQNQKRGCAFILAQPIVSRRGPVWNSECYFSAPYFSVTVIFPS